MSAPFTDLRRHHAGARRARAEGGLNYRAQRYGLAANHVTAMEVVTGDGRALRAGGGGLAIVTAIEFALVPIAEVLAGAMFWPWERAEEVLEIWRQATSELPETVDSLAAPAPLLQPLRDCSPEMDMFGPMPATGGSVLLADATPETIGALAAIDGTHLAFGVGMAMDPAGAAAIDAHVATMTEALGPWKADRSVMSFTEHATDPRAFFDPGVYDRLVTVKRRYDPDDRLIASHPARD